MPLFDMDSTIHTKQGLFVQRAPPTIENKGTPEIVKVGSKLTVEYS